MTLDRRSFVKAGVVVSATAGLGTAARAARRSPALVIYDSRLPESRAFAAGQHAPLLDIAGEHGRLWRGLRGTVLPAGPVIGLTRWSDLVIVRGHALDKGKRLRRQQQVGGLFAWELA